MRTDDITSQKIAASCLISQDSQRFFNMIHVPLSDALSRLLTSLNRIGFYWILSVAYRTCTFEHILHLFIPLVDCLPSLLHPTQF